jgi:hypothetical protein
LELLHVMGEVPEGVWAIFSTPQDDGRGMTSVLIPHTLWRWMTALDPFTSEQAWVERVGQKAVARTWGHGRDLPLVVVEVEDVVAAWSGPTPWQMRWGEAIRVCGGCGQTVPAGEVLEGMKNAMPPDDRGAVSVTVLCPFCQTATTHRLTPFGIEGVAATSQSGPSAPAG